MLISLLRSCCSDWLVAAINIQLRRSFKRQIRQAQRMTSPTVCISRIRPIVFGLLTLAFSLASIGCVKRSIQTKTNDQQSGASPQAISTPSRGRININTATANELETLPGIGKGLAERIVDHREKYGPFRRSEHLVIVRGISDRRFRALRDSISVE